MSLNQLKGFIPPQATDLEQAVLGAMLLEGESVPVVAGILHPKMFYRDNHKIIYESILRMFNRHDKIDLLTVTQEIKSAGKLEAIGGVYAITELTMRIASASNIEYHARIIVQKFIQRELINITREVMNIAYQDTTDPFELTGETINKLIELNNVGSAGQVVNVGEVYDEVMSNINDIRNGEIVDQGVYSHIKALNNLTNGFKSPDLYILAARPGMGKTALIVSLTRSIVAGGIPVGIFSLEMSKEQFTKRLLSQMTGILYGKLDKPNELTAFENQLLNELKERIHKSPLYIDDTPAINITQLHSKATELKAMHGIKIIFIDYLQLMSGVGGKSKGSNREAEIAEISRGTKMLAKTLGIPIIALSQLNRGVEQRPDKRPKLSDLRESGAIEQDADVVGLLYRPDYYGIKEIEGVSSDEIEHYGELIIAKHRNGATATLRLKFIKETMNYIDFDDYYNPQGGMVDKDIDISTSNERVFTEKPPF